MSIASSCVEVFAPAKINLYLAVTGLREDGFHDLVSLVVPLDYGDSLRVSLKEKGGEDDFFCHQEGIPLDESNLVLRALRAYRERTQVPPVSIQLVKHIPSGAGLGGGSSDAVAMLRALQQISGQALEEAALFEIAAQIGSDCPLFLYDEPVIMRGRGELLEQLPSGALSCLSGKRLLLFKPSAGISTPWAYGQMKAAAGAYYTARDVAERELRACLEAEKISELPLRNEFEGVVFKKYPVFDILFSHLRTRRYRPLMSGSGSACFVLLDEEDSPEEAIAEIQHVLGASGIIAQCALRF